MTRKPEPHVTLEVLLDFPALRLNIVKLSAAPDMPKTHDAKGWAAAYHSMVSYESALDAAGYDCEGEMKAPGAPVFVTLANIYDDGRMEVRFGTFSKEVTAQELFQAHNLELPHAEQVMLADESMTP